jgi:tyrosinase
MSFFNTAALDPIFWLHHANIDRLWTVWLRRDVGHQNPADAKWLTDLPFHFRDAGGNGVSFTPSQVVDSTALPAPLSPYRYEDEADPLAAELGPMEIAAAARRREMARRGITEMVGATEEPVELTGRPATTRISASPPTGPAREIAEAGAPLETYLNIENVTGSGGPISYSVYLNLPPDEDPEDHPELLAGVLPMFGVREASRASDRHAGSGLHYVLRVGDIVRRLQARDAWDPSDIRLTFVPERRIQERETARAEAATRPIRVGRVSLHVG